MIDLEEIKITTDVEGVEFFVIDIPFLDFKRAKEIDKSTMHMDNLQKAYPLKIVAARNFERMAHNAERRGERYEFAKESAGYAYSRAAECAKAMKFPISRLVCLTESARIFEELDQKADGKNETYRIRYSCCARDIIEVHKWLPKLYMAGLAKLIVQGQTKP